MNKPRRGLNSVHRLSLGMLNGNLLELGSNFNQAFEVWNLAYQDSAADPKTKVLKVALGDTTYYLSYRMPVAGTYDADIGASLGGRLGPVWSGRLAIHSSTTPAQSFVYAMLSPGQSWSVPGTEISIRATDSGTPDRSIMATIVGLCGNGVIDSNEQCDGGDCCSSNCTFKLSSTVCRAAFGICDESEFCSGSSAQCPPNTYSPTSKPCRANILGPCDVPDYCDGAGNCPQNVIQDGGACTLPGCALANTGLCFSRQCLGNCGAATQSQGSNNQQTSVSTISSTTTSIVAATPTVPTTTAPTIKTCGDGTCGGFEDCITCPSDCPHGVNAAGSGFCCAGWGCDGRACPVPEKMSEVCNLGTNVRLCKSSGMSCAISDECCEGRCFHGSCK
jgi:hypothetical protein